MGVGANVETSSKGFNTFTAKEAGKRSKRRKKFQIVIDELIEKYIRDEFAKDWSYLSGKEKVELSLKYRFSKDSKSK